MRFAAFEAIARARWDEIPGAYREGVDGLAIERDAKPGDDQPGVYILGECLTEAYPSDFDGPDNVRSTIVLYYGSFRRLAAEDDGFDWEAEIWETLTHELRHHLESLADEDDLDDVDAGLKHHFSRREGLPFEPGYHRLGELRDGGWYVLEHVWFVERPASDGPHVTFEWNARTYRVDVPDTDADLLYLDVVEGVDDPPAELVIVIVRPQRARARLRALFGRKSMMVAQADVKADLVSVRSM